METFLLAGSLLLGLASAELPPEAAEALQGGLSQCQDGKLDACLDLAARLDLIRDPKIEPSMAQELRTEACATAKRDRTPEEAKKICLRSEVEGKLAAGCHAGDKKACAWLKWGGSASEGGAGTGSAVSTLGGTKKPRPLVSSLSRDEIQRVIGAHHPKIRDCYERQLVTTPSLKGNVTLRLTIEPAGQVSAAEVRDSTLASVPVHDCMVAAAKGWHFPATAAAKAVEVDYPFVFKAK